MNPAAVIAKKRDGGALSAEEIAWFVNEYAAERIADYQMAALAMAIFINGMEAAETASLTSAMLHSGEILAWPDDGIPRVDKHSTGGIGDKVSLILAPLLACCDLQVPMISGRGLGRRAARWTNWKPSPDFAATCRWTKCNASRSK